MHLDLIRVSSDDPGAIEAWCEVVRLVRDHDVPLWRDTTPRMAELFLGVPYPGLDVHGYLAWHDGRPVGRVVLEMPTIENLDNLHADIWVVPSARRRGFGRQLHDFVLRHAAALGRKRLLGGTLWQLPGMTPPNLAGARFAESLGYAPAMPEVVRRLDLTALDDGVLEQVLADARSKADGYRVVVWTNPHPAEYVDDLAYLDGRLSIDAPRGDLQLEPERVDAERLRRNEAANMARERVGYHAGAIHEESGRMVAWTAISKDRSLSWHAFQQITIVDPGHRGHRLGALIKVENLRHFRSAQPGVRVVDTFNATENAYMISINERMGFRPLYAFQDWQRDL